MNRKQLFFMWVGIAAFVIMGLCPPWLIPRLNESNYLPMGYAFIWEPPAPGLPGSDYRKAYDQGFLRCRINVAQLASHWAIVAVITVGFIVTFKDRKRI